MTYQGTALEQQQPATKDRPRSYTGGQTGTIYPCCEQAVRKHCVCQISWQCPVHGGWCVGSHD